MSALADSVPRTRPMKESDLERVMAIEKAIYTHPWTRGNFVDSLKAGYTCHVMEVSGEVIGYGVMMIAANEAHLLNLSIAREWQRHGYGRSLLLHFVEAARQAEGQQMLLEVRLSNFVGRSLYFSMGFCSVAIRPGYYPTKQGREDAILMGLNL
ncbi:MAG: ribosomal protein S18-alanine N-acetyltransferase [Betaproteobacteria bacterium]|nr:MAG: ribosomal protein S18-alanine N-acetyltransferase [Betaproteobacteria bacterium]